ncbi:MAG: hypothetical protein JO307_11650 [Bryobacterales bacterium]|nr:hypothetical protein [Bryobacterales bacterium]MBV9400830.1 hypothetical protein [Bryobacterales bacterium]
MRFLLLMLALPALAQDVVKTNPADYKVELENQWVRVLRVKHAPHAKTAMHEHPASVAVFLTDVHERVTGADGQVREVNGKAGEVIYNDAARHEEENVSDQPLEAILVELKPGAPKSERVALDPVKLDPEHHLVPLENDRVRVLRTILEPHLKSPMHEHPHYVVVYLTELHTTMLLGDGTVVDNPRRPGEVAWRDYLEHQTENIGDKQAVEIQIELK